MKKQVIISQSTRRQFIKYGAMATGYVALTGPYIVRGQNLNSQIQFAQVGCGGKGSGDCGWNIRAGAHLVACCDVRSTGVDGLKELLNSRFGAGSDAPVGQAKFYKDYRELLDKEKDNIDAVNVSTADHMHAIIAASAIKRGKHVYVQKPLTHDVYEARLLRDMAREHHVATQMGNQGSASDSVRRAVEVVHTGILGPIRLAYVWSNRPVWTCGKDRPPGSDPVPPGLEWDLWLGNAPERPYKHFWPGQENGGKDTVSVYEPWAWRGWQDFGMGALGDMACHTANWPFRSLKLAFPTEIEASTSGMNTEMWPESSKIRYEFPAREGMPPVTLWWMDGGNKPPPEITADAAALLGKVSDSGCIMIGENGSIYSPDDGDWDMSVYIKLKGDEEYKGLSLHPEVVKIPQAIPRNFFSGTPDERQHAEWIQACKDGKHDVAYSNFSIAAYLTEIMLLGSVAMRVGKKLEWDGPKMKATNVPEAAQFVKREYRKGWAV
jgi:hypothetical protein